MTDADIGTTATMMAEVFACVRQQRAEITRLRALVEAAYNEGVRHGELFGMGIGGGSFDETDACKALNHPTPSPEA